MSINKKTGKYTFFTKGLLLSLSAFLLFPLSVDYVAAEPSLDIKGDIRIRPEFSGNKDFNSQLADRQEIYGQRISLKLNAVINPWLRFYLEPRHSYIDTYKPNNNVNTSAFDLYQGYAELKGEHLSARVGRQGVAYGEQRLLGYLGWKDVARSFDAVKLSAFSDTWKADIFAMHPVDIGIVASKNRGLETWEDRTLFGFYGSWLPSKGKQLDLYLIEWLHSQGASTGKGRNIVTSGLRGVYNQGAWTLKGEAVFQTGTWSNGISQSAQAYAVSAKYAFGGAWMPTLDLGFNYSPGDDKTNASRHKSFVFPFHTNHAHYGVMDFFSWNNMLDIRLKASIKPMDKVKVFLAYHLFWLDKAKGDWLNVVGTGFVNPVYGPGSANYTQTKAGDEIDFKTSYKYNKNLSFVLGASAFFPGAAVRERNGGVADQSNWGYFITSIHF